MESGDTVKKLLKSLLLALGLTVVQPARAQSFAYDFNNPSNANYYYYGLILHIPTTFPFLYGPGIQVPLGLSARTKTEDIFPIWAMGKSPSQHLTNNAAYNNGFEYGRTTTVANATRAALWQQNVGTSKKIIAPLTGKGPASFSFWDWIQVGEISLKIYGRMRAIMNAIHSGVVTIDAWKLMPKLAVMNEDDPDNPVVYLGLAPSSQGPMALIKDLTDYSDPRYRLASKAEFSNIQGLVPSLGVKPSFYGALAHYMKNDQTGQFVLARLHRNFHELMTSMSMMRRGLAGGKTDPSKRFTVDHATEGLLRLQSVDQSWENLANELSRGVAMVAPGEAAAYRQVLVDHFQTYSQLEQQAVQDALSRKAADTWAAHAAANEMNNFTLPIESDEYMAFVNETEGIIEQAASEKADLTDGKELLLQLKIEGADTAVNRMVRDEMRALRQIYAMKARRELTDRMAPTIAQGLKTLQEGYQRLDSLQQRLTRVKAGQQSASAFYSTTELQKLLNEPLVTAW